MDVVAYIESFILKEESQIICEKIKENSKEFFEAYDLTWDIFITYSNLLLLDKKDSVYCWFIKMFEFVEQSDNDIKYIIWDIILLVAYTYETVVRRAKHILLEPSDEKSSSDEQSSSTMVLTNKCLCEHKCREYFQALVDEFFNTNFNTIFEDEMIIDNKEIKHYHVLIMGALVEQYHLWDNLPVVADIIKMFINCCINV